MRLATKKYSYPEIEDVLEPFCGRKLKNPILLSDTFPELAKEWCYKKNCGFAPEDFTQFSSVKAWWTCPTCKLIYKAKICNRTKLNSSCPFCTHKIPSPDTSLAKLFPELTKEWDTTKNENLTPETVLAFSKKKAWWLCSFCNYSWRTSIDNRSARHTGCPACYKKVRDNYPIIFYEWHAEKNGTLLASKISRTNKDIVWWKCLQKHEWQASISSRTRDSMPCPECKNSRREPQHQFLHRKRKRN